MIITLIPLRKKMCIYCELFLPFKTDFDVIGMVKKSPKMFFRYNGEDMSLISIYNKNKKRRGKSKYLLFVMVDVVKDGDIIPAKVVYVRNRNKRKEYLCLISTDVNLDENEILRIYGKHWDIEVFFKVCKSYLNLSRECNSLSYDAMTTHNAVVFTRYMMLSLESRESNDNRSLGELFLYFSDEMLSRLPHHGIIFCFRMTRIYHITESISGRKYTWDGMTLRFSRKTTTPKHIRKYRIIVIRLQEDQLYCCRLALGFSFRLH